MSDLVWLQDGAELLRAVRISCGMTHVEFADALAARVGMSVPARVERAWEEGTGAPPRAVIDAVRSLAQPRTDEIGRRQFLRRAGTAATLTLIASGRDLLIASSPKESTTEDHQRDVWPLTVRGILHPESLTDLEGLMTDYRQSYGQAPASDLLERAGGLVPVLLDLQRAAHHAATRDRVLGVLGQASLLAGLLALMGPHDLTAARSYYDLALSAAREINDHDLGTYVTGSLSFHDFRCGHLNTALERIQAADASVDDRSAPMTRAWLSSLASELHARNGDVLNCERSLEQAAEALNMDVQWAAPWKGVGIFDAGKLVAYRGGDLVLLAARARGAQAAQLARDAEALLLGALSQLQPTRLKHRCTALGDLALALAIGGEVEQACARATEALGLAVQLRHAESIDRVRTVYGRLHRWGAHGSVRELADRLRVAT